jgi:8-oxo-dGTP pyrophosphatase MutT (NUDIX family)
LFVETTWDGLAVAREKPWVSSVVVWRKCETGREFLLLHRHHEGPDYGGDWAWTPPAGARQPGETPDEAAARELHEETGLSVAFTRVDWPTDDLALYVAEAPHDAEVGLDAEHDRFDWTSADEAVRRCLPSQVGTSVAWVAKLLAAPLDASETTTSGA